MAVKFRSRIGRARTHTGMLPTQRGSMMANREAFRDIEREMQRLIDHYADVSEEVLRKALEPTFDLSQKYVPEDTGELKASGYLETRKTAKGAQVIIGYAKAGNPKYAVYVHEDQDAYHKPPTRAKWLQAAVTEDFDNIRDRLIAGYKEVLE